MRANRRMVKQNCEFDEIENNEIHRILYRWLECDWICVMTIACNTTISMSNDLKEKWLKKRKQTWNRWSSRFVPSVFLIVFVFFFLMFCLVTERTPNIHHFSKCCHILFFLCRPHVFSLCIQMMLETWARTQISQTQNLFT